MLKLIIAATLMFAPITFAQAKNNKAHKKAHHGKVHRKAPKKAVKKSAPPAAAIENVEPVAVPFEDPGQ